MLNLSTIGEILTDPNLRAKVQDLAVRKVGSDVKTLQAHSALSKFLISNPLTNSDDEKSLTIKSIIDDQVDYYNRVVKMSTEYHDRLLARLRDLEIRSKAPKSSFQIEVCAPIGGVGRASFKVANSRSEPIVVSCAAAPLINEAGDHIVTGRIRFEPESLEIPSGANAVFDAVIDVDESFRSGEVYSATLSVPELSTIPLLLKLSIPDVEIQAVEIALNEPKVDNKPVDKSSEKSKAKSPPKSSSLKSKDKPSGSVETKKT